MASHTRRSFVRKAASAGSLVLGASILDACGSASTAGTSAAPAAKPHSGGTLRVGISGGGPTDTLNPLNAATVGAAARCLAMFDGLAEIDAHGLPALLLAEEITPNADATTWTVRVRKGIEFHDGHELTADDVIYTLKTILDPKSLASAAPLLTLVDGKALKKVDKYTVSVPCKAPFGTLFETFAVPLYAPIIPVGFDAKKPVGTGAFEYVSFAAGQQSTMKRNANYWKTGQPYLDELIMTDFADETSQVNALISGQVDCINDLSAASATQLRGAGKGVVVSPGAGYTPFIMNTAVAPFDDVRVRQAFRLSVDRPRMLSLVFGTEGGQIGNDIFGITAPEYDHTIPQRAQDIEQAKSLLAKAGHSQLTVPLYVAPVAQGATTQAQVFAQQIAAAGVKVQLQQVTTSSFFGPRYGHYPFSVTVWFNNLYFPQVALSTLPTSPYGETHFNNPRYNKLYAEAVATADTAKRTEIAHEMQGIDFNEGGNIIPFFPPIIDGHAPNVHGFVPTRTGLALNGYDFAAVFLA